MANTNAPFGFRQYSGNGSAPTYEQVAVSIGYNTTNIFYGGPVEPAADGTVAQGDGTTAAAGIAGIFVGCQYLSTSQKRTVWSNYYPGGTDPASGTIIGYIINDPNARFVVQNGSSSAIGVDAIDANAGYTTGTGNTANGISGATLDRSSIDVTSTLPFRIVGLVQNPPGSPGTDITSGYNWVIVAFNNVTTKNQTGI